MKKKNCNIVEEISVELFKVMITNNNLKTMIGFEEIFSIRKELSVFLKTFKTI
jgi:hypothetical protein